MAFLWDLLDRGLKAHPKAAAPPPEPEAGAALPDITVEKAVAGLIGVEKIAFAARAAIAAKGGDLPADARLTLAVLDEAALFIPAAAQIDEAVHVAAVLIPFLVDLRREHPMNNPVVDAQTAHATPYWR